jgi:hypothetical protein
MTQKLSTYFPSRVCNVQADEYQMRPPRPQLIAMWLPERLLPRRAQYGARRLGCGRRLSYFGRVVIWMACNEDICCVEGNGRERLLPGKNLEVLVAKPVYGGSESFNSLSILAS